MDIRDKAILVAGGSGNLGSAVAAHLRERGARVTILDLRAPDPPSQTAFLQADIADDDAVQRALAEFRKTEPKVHALVNCAGLIHSEPLINLMAATDQRTHRVSTWDATLRSNLTATFVLGVRVAEAMASSRVKGVIVNFSSIAASGNPGQTAYAASKAGIEAMTAVWGRELGPFGIRAVAIAPGFVDTPSTHASLSETMLSDLKRRTPLQRLAKPEEIASAVLFAIENDFITGTTIAVGGGLVL